VKRPALSFHFQIALALVLGLGLGQLTRLGVGGTSFGFGGIAGISAVEIYGTIGQVFLRLLQMVVIPLIATAVLTGVAGLARDQAFARLGLRTTAYYLTTTLLATLTGLFLANTIRPGETGGQPALSLLGLTTSSEEIEQSLGQKDVRDFASVLLRMIPVNVLDAATRNGDMLAVLFFAILVGCAAARLPESVSGPFLGAAEGLYQIMLKITGWIMVLAPLGVFGLVARVSATTHPADMKVLIWLLLTVLGGLALHLGVTLPLMLRLLAGVSPIRHFRAMAPALLTAFSTSSSNATLPVTLDCLQTRAGVSRRTAGFVTPLGATVNMDGTALYECVCVLFIAQLYGVDLTLAQQASVVALSLLTSLGVAGIPSASLVAIMVILASLQLPIEAIGVLMIFDRVLDMARTAVNVFSDTVGAVILARAEGEATTLRDNASR
jgi:Na+/H+-dicarboxylate symporter